MMKQTISSPIRKLKLLLVLPLMAGVFYAFAAPEYKFVQVNSNSNAQSQTTADKTVTGKVVNEDGKPLKGASIVVSGKTIGTTSDANGNFKLEMPDDSPIVISYVGFETQMVNPDFGKEIAITMKTKTISLEFDKQTSETRKKEPLDLNESNALVIVNGKEIFKADLVKIDPDKIESIEVLKNKASVEKYGEKGKDGVVLITLKPNEKSLATQTIKVQANSPLKFGNSDGSENQPLIVIDGIVTGNKNVNTISPETIESIDVLKGESATKLYGEKGRNGVILIKTKKGAATTNTPIDIKMTGTSGTEPKPLIVIDGVIAENQNMDKIDPESVASMAVLKDESATKKYGDKAKNGVIEITSKSKTLFTMVEEMPEFPGGVDALRTFIISTMKYPVIALENRIQGQVYVKFVVEKTGKVTNVKISRGVDPSLDNEALRIVKSMPKWNPGKQNGENVDVAYEIPINFSYPKDYHPKNREKLRTK